MSPTATNLRPAYALGLSALSLLVCSGCGDAQSDPMAVLVAAETHGALAAAERLPGLPDLDRAASATADFGQAASLWADSWHEPADEGRNIRAAAYALAVPELSARLGSEGIGAALAAVHEVLDAAEALDPTETPAFVHEGLIAGSILAADADRALARGDLGRSLTLTLEAADGLRELAPKEVAGRLIDEAEAALGRNGEDAPYSELDLERSRHLLVSAGEAMDDADYLRAIRRAYYACRLLGVDLD